MWSNPHHFADILALETLVSGVYARVVCRISPCGHMLAVAGSTHCVNWTLCSTDPRGATQGDTDAGILGKTCSVAINMFQPYHDT